MLAALAAPILARATVWLAAGMLLLPCPPHSACGCRPGNGAQATCCCAKRAGNCRHAPTASCCARRAASARDQRSPCCGRHAPAVAVAARTATGCGPACPCCVSRHLPPAPATLPLPAASGVERSAAVPAAPSALMVAGTHAPALRPHDLPQLAIATALDRCITLSRFTC